MTDMVVARGLCKAFDGVQALRGVDLTVPKGCVYGLVGPNGAGKSTLIAHLNGSVRADAGTLEFDGQPLWENEAAKARIATVPSELYFPTRYSVDDYARLCRDVHPAFSVKRFKELAAAFDLDPAKPVERMSKGMQKQAAFWLALSLRPDVLLLDEPLDGLDPLVRKTVWGLVMEDVAERETTVLVSSHNLRELEGVCDHLGVMRAGRMLHEYDLADTADGLAKVQVALPDGVELPRQLEIVTRADDGRFLTLVVRGDADGVHAAFQALDPVLLHVAPLSLEELFLYEVGGAHGELKELLD